MLQLACGKCDGGVENCVWNMAVFASACAQNASPKDRTRCPCSAYIWHPRPQVIAPPSPSSGSKLESKARCYLMHHAPFLAELQACERQNQYDIGERNHAMLDSRDSQLAAQGRIFSGRLQKGWLESSCATMRMSPGPCSYSSCSGTEGHVPNRAFSVYLR